MAIAKKILVSAFACDPLKGSEPGNGWHWVSQLTQNGFEVHCLTRTEGQQSIESQDITKKINFHFVELPMGMERLYSHSQLTMYVYYLLWQYKAYRKAKKISKHVVFDLVQHVTWGSLQLGSFLYKLKRKFVFGPVGGGQKAVPAFKEYFGDNWQTEIRRNQVSDLLQKYNPACRHSLSKSALVCVSNQDTKQLAAEISKSEQKIHLTFDAALPESFFPADFAPKVVQGDTLKLLWTGRLMPRKGLLLMLDIMESIKEYRNISLTIVGDGEQMDLLKRLVEEKKLHDTVNLVGKVTHAEVRKYYADYDLFVFSSLRDSCPAQLLEAMAFGMPVITLKMHGQAEMVNSETGILCECETPAQAIAEFRKAILYCKNNPGIISEMSRSAHAFAKQHTWEKKVKYFIDNIY